MAKNTLVSRNIREIVKCRNIEKFLRPIVLKSLLTLRVVEVSSDYTDELAALDPQTYLEYRIVLLRAHRRAHSLSDVLGVVGIPLFLGMIAAYVAFGLPAIVISVFFIAIWFYVLFYLYYRMMTANLEILIEVAKLTGSERSKENYGETISDLS